MDAPTESVESVGAAERACFAIAGFPSAAIAFLTLAATLSLVLSHYSRLWHDECLVLC